MTPPSVLIGCECSGIIREAFRRHGCDAWSCDLKPAEDNSPHHIQDDIRVVAAYNKTGTTTPQWDLFIVHPECTYLTVANTWGNRGCSKYTPTQFLHLRKKATDFFFDCVELCRIIGRGGIENPVGIMSTAYRKPDQIIHPWQYGEDASKATCLWLTGLPLLVPTNILPGGRKARRANQTASGQNRLGPSPTRAADRARTYPGIAEAMASQWSPLPSLL